jgi:hypothetical protein
MGKILRDIFEEEAFEKILKWADSSMNYPEKADKIDKLMKKYGLKPLDSGTNRIVYTHKDYPKVVFKIGFDPQGILDNLNEYHKASLREEFASSPELDEEGLILIQEKCPTIDFDLFQKKDTKKKIRKILEQLDEEGFILVDLGLDKHKNYGVDKKGNIRIIDFGYVELKSVGNFSCPHIRYKGDGDKKKYCKGHLEYNKDFTKLECSECENVFKIDVVLEGYTETKYASAEKLPKYKPSKELDEFYKNFTKHRDRATLKQYVALSNRSDSTNINNGGGAPEVAHAGLNKLKQLSGNSGSGVSSGEETVKKSSVPSQERDSDCDEPQARSSQKEEILPTTETTKPLTVYHSTQRGIDVLKPDEQVDQERNLQSLNQAFELINTNLSEDSDKLIRDLFFARFPSVAEAIQDIDKDLRESSEAAQLCQDAGIEIYAGANNNDEIHFGIQLEQLKKDPWIIMSKGEVIVHINLREHMEKIVQIDTDDETELIVSRMEVTALKEFNGDYEETYFGDGNEESDHEDQD